MGLEHVQHDTIIIHFPKVVSGVDTPAEKNLSKLCRGNKPSEINFRKLFQMYAIRFILCFFAFFFVMLFWTCVSRWTKQTNWWHYPGREPPTTVRTSKLDHSTNYCNHVSTWQTMVLAMHKPQVSRSKLNNFNSSYRSHRNDCVLAWKQLFSIPEFPVGRILFAMWSTLVSLSWINLVVLVVQFMAIKMSMKSPSTYFRNATPMKECLEIVTIDAINGVHNQRNEMVFGFLQRDCSYGGHVRVADAFG